MNLLHCLRVRIRAARLFSGSQKGWSEPYFFAHYESYSSISVDILRLAFSQAVEYIKSQEAQYYHIVKVSSTMLGWLVAALISLTGASVALIPGGWSTFLALCIYGIVVLFFPAIVLVFGVHFGQSSYYPGSRPSAFLSAKTWDGLSEIEDTSTQEKWFLMGSLWQLERAAFLNNKWNLRRVKAYRLAVLSTLAGVLGALILIIIL